jgi:hypothetical protein
MVGGRGHPRVLRGRVRRGALRLEQAARSRRQLLVRASDRAYGRSSCARIRGRTTMQDRLECDAGSPGQKLGQLPRSPSNRVDQKLAVLSSDDLSAGVEISVRIGKLTLQLGDAIDQQVHIMFHGIGWTLGTAHGVSVPGSLAVFINQGEIQTTSTGAVLRSRRHSCRGQVSWSGDGCTSIGRAVRTSPRRNHPAPGAEGFAHARSLRGFRLMQPTPLTSACRSPRRCFWQLLQHVHPPHPRPRL